tara:strand:- start:1590 stop:1754 length:165 start_codon:yes stop_codon:yes gene_type:complete
MDVLFKNRQGRWKVFDRSPVNGAGKRSVDSAGWRGWLLRIVRVLIDGDFWDFRI